MPDAFSDSISNVAPDRRYGDCEVIFARLKQRIIELRFCEAFVAHRKENRNDSEGSIHMHRRIGAQPGRRTPVESLRRALGHVVRGAGARHV
jgi:hypothetical protein